MAGECVNSATYKSPFPSFCVLHTSLRSVLRSRSLHPDLPPLAVAAALIYTLPAL